MASCNSTNFFIVRGREICPTSTSLYSFKGGDAGQRDRRLARRQATSRRECDFTLSQVYSADEAFGDGKRWAAWTPVTKVDGRLIANGTAGRKVTKEASDLYF